MEVKRICQWCGKPFMAKKTTTNYCSPQCSKRGYKHRMKERRMELREIQEMLELKRKLEEMLELKRKLESQEYFTFSQAARLMGVSRQYVYKLVKEDKLRASRLSSRMSLIRRSDIELMLKTKPYESIKPKDDVDITEYYTATLPSKLPKSTKSRKNGFGHIQERTISPKSVFASSTTTARSISMRHLPSTRQMTP